MTFAVKATIVEKETIDWERLHKRIWDVATEIDRMLLNSMGYQKTEFTQREKRLLKRTGDLLARARMVIYHEKLENKGDC
jgi:hypothetical protein